MVFREMTFVARKVVDNAVEVVALVLQEVPLNVALEKSEKMEENVKIFMTQPVSL